jgi:hypothetical protein
MPNYPIPSRLGALALTREERAIVKHARTQERQVIATRISDVGRRQVASGRMRDIADLTNDALEAGVRSVTASRMRRSSDRSSPASWQRSPLEERAA